MKKYRHTIITLVLVILGSIVFFSFNNEYEGIVFFISYMALILALMGSLRNEIRATKIRKTEIVTGRSIDDLQSRLSEKLEDMEKKSIISVQMVDRKTALIVYTEQ